MPDDLRHATRDEAGYPRRLLRLGPDAPAEVWWRGSLPASDLPAGAVVGSRDVPAAGRSAARRAAGWLVRSGLVVVSGLSPGVDEVAHRECLEQGGIGLAVVAGGPDVAESARLAGLAERLVRHGGAVLSEHPPGTPVTAQGRAARCRLQVACSDEVLVAWLAGPDDGTVHAIRAARALGVPVVAVEPDGPARSGRMSP